MGLVFYFAGLFVAGVLRVVTLVNGLLQGITPLCDLLRGIASRKTRNSKHRIIHLHHVLLVRDRGVPHIGDEHERKDAGGNRVVFQFLRLATYGFLLNGYDLLLSNATEATSGSSSKQSSMSRHEVPRLVVVKRTLIW